LLVARDLIGRLGPLCFRSLDGDRFRFGRELQKRLARLNEISAFEQDFGDHACNARRQSDLLAGAS
jgi:hypothetical protein